ncbi:hypothetical protein RhiirA5_425694 [Rhizophagus irregularis]|uniref:Protein kinase domain-containing protein n=1 Tax=Rhizophagus irregularis TaxID=588596 RepID=A0A2N0P5M0_9GLOM|nr:hypothetical protein RhiirA5_425694 [Rhizophagus irregularis]
METEFSKSLNISGGNINHKNCTYCNKPFTEELWCKECDPFRIIEGWTSENSDIDKFIKKDTIYKKIGEGGFAKVYSATWINGKSEYYEHDDGSWKKEVSRSIKVALKKAKWITEYVR